MSNATRASRQVHDNEWKMVGKKTKKQTGTQQRLGAIIIKAKEGASYAEILGPLKSDANLNDLGEKCRKVTRNVTGNLVLEISRETQTKMRKFANFGKTPRRQRWWCRRPQKQKVLKELDELTQLEDVIVAPRSQL